MITYLFFLFLAALTILSAFMVVTAANPVHSVLFLIFCFFSSAGLFIMSGAEFVSMILLVVYVGAVAVLFMFVVMMMDMDRDNKKQDNENLDATGNLLTNIIKSFKEVFVNNILKTAGKSIAGLFVFLISIGAIFSIFNVLKLLPNDLTAFGLYNAINNGDLASGEYFSRLSLFLQSSDYGLENFLITIAILISLTFSFVLAFGLTNKEETTKEEKGKNKLKEVPWSAMIIVFMFIEFIMVMFRHGFVTVGEVNEAASGIGNISNTHQIAKVLYTDNIVAFQIAGVVLLLSMIGAIVLTMHHKMNVKRQDIRRQLSRKKDETCKLTDPEIGKGIDI